MAPQYDFPLGISQHDPNFGKILQIINGFRGYETLDDMKAADGQVRKRLAEQLDKAIGESKGARDRLSSNMFLQVLPDFDRMVEHIGVSKEKLLHPMSDKITSCRLYRPERGPISEIYTIDFKMLSAAENVYNLMQEFIRMVREDMILGNIHKIDTSLKEIGDTMARRDQVIACMLE